jgi:hypothetical protein
MEIRPLLIRERLLIVIRMTAWVEWIAKGLRPPRDGHVLATDGEDAGQPEPGESEGDGAGKGGEKGDGPRAPRATLARPRRPPAPPGQP